MSAREAKALPLGHGDFSLKTELGHIKSTTFSGLCNNIKIFNACEVWIEKSVRGSLFGITRLCRVMPNSDPEGRSFLSAPNGHDIFFFLHTLWSPASDFNVGLAINESRSYTLTSVMLSRMWRRNDVNSQRLNVRVTCPPSNQPIDITCYSFLCPATRKWRGIMLYPPKFWVSVRPSVCLSVRPSVRQRPPPFLYRQLLLQF